MSIIKLQQLTKIIVCAFKFKITFCVLKTLLFINKQGGPRMFFQKNNFFDGSGSNR